MEKNGIRWNWNILQFFGSPTNENDLSIVCEVIKRIICKRVGAISYALYTAWWAFFQLKWKVHVVVIPPFSVHGRTESKGLRGPPVRIHTLDMFRKGKYPLGKSFVKSVSKLTVKEHMDTKIWFLGGAVHWESMNKNTSQRCKCGLQPMVLALGFNLVSVYFPREIPWLSTMPRLFFIFSDVSPIGIYHSSTWSNLALIIHSIQSTWLHNSHGLRTLVCSGCYVPVLCILLDKCHKYNTIWWQSERINWLNQMSQSASQTYKVIETNIKYNHLGLSLHTQIIWHLIDIITFRCQIFKFTHATK